MLPLLLLAVIESGARGASLLRTPKVYNALITTDQNLTPSRAFPVVRPAIHESPWLYPPYSFTPLRFYDAYGPFNGLANTQGLYSRLRGSGVDIAPGVTDVDRSFIVSHDVSDNSISNHLNRKSPIPLNEFGLPPSLVPIVGGQRPVDLAPYNFNSYPLIYDRYDGFQQGEYLPHYGYVPQNSYAASVSGDVAVAGAEAGAAAGGATATVAASGETAASAVSAGDSSKSVIALPADGASTSTSDTQSSFSANSADVSSSGGSGLGSSSSSTSTSSTSTSTRSGRVFYFDDDIKNNHNRNKDIVDVPPPPLPVGAKASDAE